MTTGPLGLTAGSAATGQAVITVRSVTLACSWLTRSFRAAFSAARPLCACTCAWSVATAASRRAIRAFSDATALWAQTGAAHISIGPLNRTVDSPPARVIFSIEEPLSFFVM